jgi:hypothetical protein
VNTITSGRKNTVEVPLGGGRADAFATGTTQVWDAEAISWVCRIVTPILLTPSWWNG